MPGSRGGVGNKMLPVLRLGPGVGFPPSVTAGGFNADGEEDLAVVSGLFGLILGNVGGIFAAQVRFTSRV